MGWYCDVGFIREMSFVDNSPLSPLSPILSTSLVYPLPSPLHPPSSFLHPLSSIHHPLSSILHPLSSIIHPLSSLSALPYYPYSPFHPPSIIHPPSSILHPQSSIFHPLSSILYHPFSILDHLYQLSPIPCPLLFFSIYTELSYLFISFHNSAYCQYKLITSSVLAQPIVLVNEYLQKKTLNYE